MLLLCFVLLGCKSTSDYSNEASVPTNDSGGDRIIKICIEKHYYYKTVGGYEGGIAPVLTDNGKPVHCK